MYYSLIPNCVHVAHIVTIPLTNVGQVDKHETVGFFLMPVKDSSSYHATLKPILLPKSNKSKDQENKVDTQNATSRGQRMRSKK